jgi:hypothetical protein
MNIPAAFPRACLTHGAAGQPASWPDISGDLAKPGNLTRFNGPPIKIKVDICVAVRYNVHIGFAEARRVWTNAPARVLRHYRKGRPRFRLCLRCGARLFHRPNVGRRAPFSGFLIPSHPVMEYRKPTGADNRKICGSRMDARVRKEALRTRIIFPENPFCPHGLCERRLVRLLADVRRIFGA